MLPIAPALDVVTDAFVALRLRPGTTSGEADDADLLGAPLLLELELGAALPLWRSAASARAFEAAAPEALAARLEPQRLAADDLRAKEELLRDALASGAALVVHDPVAAGGDDGFAGAAGRDLTERALNELLAERRALACL